MSDVKASDVVSWWTSNKKWIYPLIAAIVGLFGGNVDRVGQFVPDFTDSALEKRVSDLEAKQCDCVNTLHSGTQNFERKYNK